MKNFYEATIIKPKLTIAAKLTLTPVGVLPCLVQFNNEILFDETIGKPKELSWLIPIELPIVLTVRIARTHPKAIIIGLTLDENEIIPMYQDCAIPPTCYYDVSGTWCLSLPPFYSWFYKKTGQGWIA